MVVIDFPFFVNRFYKHDELKDEILKSLETSTSREESKDDTITKTDWGLEIPLGTSDYQQLILPHIISQSQKTFNRGSALEITDMWFQQYYKGDTHGWHVHEYCHWANVYFVELPSKNFLTEIVDLNRVPIEYEAQEGDIISFPSMLLHRSKPNISIDRKTVIAYNVNFTHIREYDPW